MCTPLFLRAFARTEGVHPTGLGCRTSQRRCEEEKKRRRHNADASAFRSPYSYAGTRRRVTQSKIAPIMRMHHNAVKRLETIG